MTLMSAARAHVAVTPIAMAAVSFKNLMASSGKSFLLVPMALTDQPFSVTVCAEADRACSRVHPGNRQKFPGIETGAADQRAVHVVDCHQLLGIRRLHRAAVEDAYPLGGRRKPRGQPLADEAVDLGDVGRCRREPGADRPYGLVGNDEVLGGRAVWNRALKLHADHRKGPAGGPVIATLADAYDGEEPGAPRRPGLAPHVGVGFVVERAALGMADDHGAGAEIGQHLGGDIAREGATRFGVAVLAADLDDAFGAPDELSDQGRRRTYDDVDFFAEPLGADHDLAKVFLRPHEAVHLPVAGNQRASRCHPFSPMKREHKRTWRGG